MKNFPFAEKTGPISADSHLYIQREADDEIVQLLRRGEYIQLSEPQDQGKTSLIYHVRSQLNRQPCSVVYVLMSSLRKTSEADWYYDLCERLIQYLRDFLQLKNLTQFPSDASSWRSFLRQLMRCKTLSPDAGPPQIVIALDEIEALAHPWASSFFQILREVYTTRSIEPEFQRLSFILSGSFNPKYLAADSLSSPFNIAHRINLRDFSLDQVSHIAHSLVLLDNSNVSRNDIAKRLYYWTDGQPYLTQWIGRYLEYLAQNGEATTHESVDNAVNSLLQGDGNRRDNEHLSRISRGLKREPELLDYLEHAVKTSIPFAPSPEVNPEQFQLVHVYGLLKVEKGMCHLRNRIYEIWLIIRDQISTGPTWQEWAQRIEQYLRTEGQVSQLSSHIPEFAWQAIIKMYTQKSKQTLPIDDTDSGRIILRRGVTEVSELNFALQEANRELKEHRRLNPSGSLERLTQLLQRTVALKSTERWESRGLLQATIVEIVNNMVKNNQSMPKEAPLFFVPASEIPTDTTSSLDVPFANLAGSLRSTPFFSFVIPISRSETQEAADMERLSSVLARSPYNFVLLSRDALLEIFTQTDSYTALLKCIARQVSPYLVSPFIVRGPVNAKTGMFYGREREVGRIVNGLTSNSFVIIGNRRIGKSSLLQRVQQHLLYDPRYYVKDMKHYEGHNPSTERMRSDFAELESNAKGRIIVQVIDEIDNLLRMDSEQLYRRAAIWRELSETGRCRFVFAGHRILRRSRHDARSPFYNFCEPVTLGFLDRSNADRLLVEPLMDRLGFDLKPKERILDTVWNISAGHPNVIQSIGFSLLEGLKRGREVITIDDLNQVIDSKEFRSEYEDAIWGGTKLSSDAGVTALERLILLIGDPNGFTLENMELMLRQNRVVLSSQQQLRDALALLIDFNLLKEEITEKGRPPQKIIRYVCTVKEFRRRLFALYSRDYLLDYYKKEMNKKETLN